MYNIIKKMLKNALIGMFEYENMPNGVDGSRFEMELIENGTIIFTDVIDNVFCVSKVYEDNVVYDFYGNVISGVAKSVYTKFDKRVIHKNNGVFVKNNIDSCSDIRYICDFAKHLAQAYNYKDKNILLSNFIGIVETKDPKQAKALSKEINRIIKGKSPFIVTANKHLTEQLNATNFGVNLNSVELWDNFNNILALFFTFYGINNNAVDKKERLIVDEVNANNQLLDNVRADRLAQREKAVKEINELYGLNITVKLKGSDNNDIKERVNEDNDKEPNDESS